MIGRYEILAEIGRGELGAVYQGHDSENDRVVAIKAIPIAEFPESNPLQFFLDARAVKRLTHPGIVELYDVGISNEKQMLYLVREYVAGVTLETILQSGSLSPETALQTAKELAEALDHAHRQGFIHGNVQPYNILITEEGHAKLAEFSGSRLSRSFHGDNAFFAPEQLNGGVADAQTDLFSLGALLYTMLTGHVPFHGRGASPVDWSAHRRALSIANNGPLHISPEVDQLLAKALAKNPADRFQVARQMAYAIQKVLEPAVPEPVLEDIAPESLVAIPEQRPTPEVPAVGAPASQDIEIVISAESVLAFMRVHRLWLYPSAAVLVLILLFFALTSRRTPAGSATKSATPQAARHTAGGSKPGAGLSRASRAHTSPSNKHANDGTSSDQPESASATQPQP
ncbi:serine/threonine protein kinase [Candidatus Koribacter versatilis Ellin345]|uniref:Serine/threonine protein kinase n=2 Tax=Candidatus Korobacter versatilis TaxID=658062 RepID=Q1IQT9_KORVE|nr:serine/threonine protein kinase [Candidatus Koribacter versatilis Ellin345]